MISQITFYIAPEIEAALLSGDLTQHGGIVRNALGQIVQHLPEVTLPANSEKVLAQVAALSKSTWIGAAVVVGLALGASAIIVAWNRKRGVKKVPECVDRYNTSWGAYLDAVKAENMDKDILERLISDFDAVREYSDEGGSITLDLSTKQGEALLNLVLDYTRQLSEANAVQFNELQGQPSASRTDAVVDLRRYLEVQRQIFHKAA